MAIQQNPLAFRPPMQTNSTIGTVANPTSRASASTMPPGADPFGTAGDTYRVRGNNTSDSWNPDTFTDQYVTINGQPMLRVGHLPTGSTDYFRDPSKVIYDPQWGYVTPRENLTGGSHESFYDKYAPWLMFAAAGAGIGLEANGLIGSGAGTGGTTGAGLGPGGGLDPETWGGAGGMGGTPPTTPPVTPPVTPPTTPSGFEPTYPGDPGGVPPPDVSAPAPSTPTTPPTTPTTPPGGPETSGPTYPGDPGGEPPPTSTPTTTPTTPPGTPPGGNSLLNNPLVRTGAGTLANQLVNGLTGNPGGGHSPGQPNTPGGPGLGDFLQRGLSSYYDNQNIQQFWQGIQDLLNRGDYNSQYRPGYLSDLARSYTDPDSFLKPYAAGDSRDMDNLSRREAARGFNMSGNELGDLTQLQSELRYRHLNDIRNDLRSSITMGHPETMSAAAMQNLPFLFAQRQNRNAANTAAFAPAFRDFFNGLGSQAQSAISNWWSGMSSSGQWQDPPPEVQTLLQQAADKNGQSVEEYIHNLQEGWMNEAANMQINITGPTGNTITPGEGDDDPFGWLNAWIGG